MASVPGSFVYNPTNGAVLNTGTNGLSVLFSPADPVDYSSAGANASLVVLPAALSATASNASRAYGQSNPMFGGTISGLQNQDNITVTYSCNAGSNSAVGTYAIVPALVDPADRQTNYTVSLVNGVLTVAQAIPVVSWTNPAPITYGAALASNELNATASVPGSFVYNPTNGAVLNTGTNGLSVLFSPADPVDYGSAGANASLVVLPAALSVTASNASRAYGQANPVFGGTISGLQSQDNITVTYNCNAGSNSAVGTVRHCAGAGGSGRPPDQLQRQPGQRHAHCDCAARHPGSAAIRPFIHLHLEFNGCPTVSDSDPNRLGSIQLD